MNCKSAESDSQFCDSLCQSDLQLPQKWLVFCDAILPISSPEYIHMYIYTYIYIYMYLHIYICIYTYIHIYTYIYIHTYYVRYSRAHIVIYNTKLTWLLLEIEFGEQILRRCWYSSSSYKIKNTIYLGYNIIITATQLLQIVTQFMIWVAIFMQKLLLYSTKLFRTLTYIYAYV